MKVVQIIVSLFVMGCAVLTLSNLLAFDIALPLMFLGLACLNILNAYTCYKEGKKLETKILIGAALLILIVALCSLIF